MASLIPQVKSRLFIRSAQKSLHALDGAYASLVHGRSHDFEDLRAYEFGDQVRDIDWRATAKQGTPLVKRFRANRMQTILFAVDTGRSMAALSRDEKPKSDLVTLAVGGLGVLALRHGDDVSLVYGDADRVQRRPPRRSEGALELLLRTLDAAIENATAPGSVEKLLQYVIANVSRRMIVVVVTDETPITAEIERLLRRARVQHDMLWITLADADPVLDHSSREARGDVLSRWEVPQFAHGDDEIVAELETLRAAERGHRAAVLDGLEITHAMLTDQDDAVPELLRLLHRRSHAGN